MKKIIRLKESDLQHIVKRVLSEQTTGSTESSVGNSMSRVKLDSGVEIGEEYVGDYKRVKLDISGNTNEVLNSLKRMKYKGAIAFDGISSAKKMDLKILDIEGVEPTKANIISGAYTLFRPLFVAVNKHNKNPKVTGFIDFLLGPEGQKIVSSEGTINLEEGIKLKNYGIKELN